MTGMLVFPVLKNFDSFNFIQVHYYSIIFIQDIYDMSIANIIVNYFFVYRMLLYSLLKSIQILSYYIDEKPILIHLLTKT